VLDPAAEQIQHAKKQRERIYDDDTYIMNSKAPENTPEWACIKNINEETDTEMSEIKTHTDDNYDEVQYDDTNFTDPDLDFILNSAEMNSIRPEDLDESAECSKSVS
jgi:hypothetical protein